MRDDPVMVRVAIRAHLVAHNAILGLMPASGIGDYMHKIRANVVMGMCAGGNNRNDRFPYYKLSPYCRVKLR